MYGFTSRTVNLDQLSEGLAKMNDADLLRGKAAEFMCSPQANSNDPPRESFVIQLTEARAEWEPESQIENQHSPTAMDILAGLRDKLRFIERFYAKASEPFRETMRKIDVEEEPYVPPPYDPDTGDEEPYFLTEWQDADESLNLIGQAALNLVQAALREYLNWFLKLSRVELTAKGAHWLERYKNQFLETFGIDWNQGPVSFAELEEIVLARNDVEHSGTAFGMTKSQSKKHQERFPLGLFVHEIDRQIAASSEHEWSGRIYITHDSLVEAIRRVERFCEFLDERRPW